MRFASAVVCLLFPVACFAGSLKIVPTTTLAAQTSGNTSAATSFTSQSNGNTGRANVSKVNIHSLLYAGASTKIFAHMVLWFGKSNHMNVGYNSTDPVEVKKQIQDMISRGIDGVILDWHGPGNSIDQATEVIMNEAEAHPGFTFAVMVDHGAIAWDSCSGCSPQQALAQQMQYLEQKYFPSSAYLRFNGAPVVATFGIEPDYTIDWNALNKSLSTAPDVLFQNDTGFSYPLAGGSQAWVIPTQTDYGMSYLGKFYAAAFSHPSERAIGASYKGFNDTLASWGSNRIMGQQCGQTWLQTFSKIRSLYNSGKQLPALQLVTWNDYEEGTEIETGIDNCVGLSASIAGGTLGWSVSGRESTIDHYIPYISTDGQHLMPLEQIPSGLHSLNLCSFDLAAQQYKLYVQAIGKPGLLNHMSGGLSYTPHCSSGSSTSVSISIHPGSVSVSSAQPQTANVTLTPKNGPFNSSLALSCSGLPQGLSCAFSPSAVTPGKASKVSRLTFSVGAESSSLPISRGHGPMYVSFLFGAGVFGWIGVGSAQRRRVLQALLVVGIAGLLFWLTSCGGGAGGAGAAAGDNTYTVTVYGTAGNVYVSTPVRVVVH